MKPIIGITTYGRREKKVLNPAFDDHYALPSHYVDAVRRAGGIAALLPPEESDFEALVSKLDGIILSGGGDVDPELYGGDPDHPMIGPINQDRDTSEIDLTRFLLDRGNIPVLFICRGMQVLNVALGGSLHEHIEDLGRGDIHRCPENFWALQSVTVSKQTLLHHIVGKDEVRTMSGHHQGVDRLGSNLITAALAEDGIVEAVQVAGHPFALAVQWHPEASAGADPDQQKLFDSLIDAARVSAEGHGAGSQGNTVASVDAAALAVFHQEGVADLVRHRTGHGIGMMEINLGSAADEDAPL